jgi:hypothetical protein
LLPDLHGPCYDEEADSCVQKLMAALQRGGAVCSRTTMGGVRVYILVLVCHDKCVVSFYKRFVVNSNI